MLEIPSVREFLPEVVEDKYDLFVAAIGYEQRSRFIAEHFDPKAETRLALGFPEKHIYFYDENRQWYVTKGYHLEEPDDAGFEKSIRAAILQMKRSGRRVRVAVDISSLTRTRIALLVEVFRESELCPTDVDFLYALAKYSPPPKVSSVNTHVGPVLPSFAGWWADPERPTVAVVGLGYEENKALGAVEHIQASDLWLFTPTSGEVEYSKALEASNETLLKQTRPNQRFEYQVERPLDCFVNLELLVASLLRDCNPILLPFGPKIFSLICLLVAAIHPSTAVWRVSGAEDPVNRVATGDVYGLSACFGQLNGGDETDSEEETAVSAA